MKFIFIKDQNYMPLPDEVCAAIGNFDGVHLGHQKLIEECKKHGYKSAVLTFYPHPSVFIKKMANYPLITPLEHKKDIISRMGVDYLIVIEFNEAVANLSKERFIEIMKTLNIKACVCGYDFTFGKMAEGTIEDLRENFEFYEVKKFVFDNVRVSSTYIKELLTDGNVSEANRLLGRPFSIRGRVKYGNQIGRTIGFPTANLNYLNYFIPGNGVYFVNVKVDGVLYLGMCNVGNNPTFNFQINKQIEVNIFNFDEDIYDSQIEVFFVKKIRDEIKFKDAEGLKKQLTIDKSKCLEIAGDMYYTK